jgi:uncharacterized membrane protein
MRSMCNCVAYRFAIETSIKWQLAGQPDLFMFYDRVMGHRIRAAKVLVFAVLLLLWAGNIKSFSQAGQTAVTTNMFPSPLQHISDNCLQVVACVCCV